MSGTTFRELIDKDDVKIGMFVAEFATPGLGPIMASAGIDFAMVDMEHAGLSFETVKAVLRNLHAAGIATMTRPPSRAYHHLARACDVGAQGVMPPMLGDAETARRMVASIKYVPDGERGVALGFAHDDYAPGAVLDKFRAANAKTSLVGLIETREGIDNIDEIAAVDGVDVLWIGHFDLSCALGLPGQFDHPDFLDACDKVIRAARANGKPVGRVGANDADARHLIERGFDMILVGTDVGLLRGALAERANATRRIAAGA